MPRGNVAETHLEEHPAALRGPVQRFPETPELMGAHGSSWELVTNRRGAASGSIEQARRGTPVKSGDLREIS